MKNNLFVIVMIALVFVVGFGIGWVSSPIGRIDSTVPLGGMVHNTQETFDAGIAVQGTEFISSSRALSVTTISGTTGTFSSTLGVGGKITVASASSTIQVGNTTSGIAPGCIVLGDSGGATATPVYITATGGTLTATTTTPAICE